MTSPYGDARKCQELSKQELEATFYARGPNVVRARPTARTQRQWDKAKEVCIECPVFLACRETAWGEEYGVLGGTDQYERHLYRRRRQRQVRALPAAQQAALGARFHARTGRETPETIARRTGLSAGLVKALIREHRARLEEQRVLRAAAKAAAAGAIGTLLRPVWPAGAPSEGHGWIFRDGTVFAGHYVAQTASGGWLRMKFRDGHKSPVIRWFPEADVDLRMEVCPNIETWRGRDAPKSDSGESAAA